MESSEEFLTNFHNLKGFTVGEKKKSLFCLAKSMESLDSNSLHSLLCSITPKNYLESLFRVELLIHFQRAEDLFGILQTESEDLSVKIFKQPWLFQDPLHFFTAELIVDYFLTHLSFVIRNRVIKSLAKYNKDETRNDQIFDKLLDRYGIDSAKQIIRACSIKKIEDILKKHTFKLTSPDLIPIFHKDPHLFELYAESHKDDLDDDVDWRIVREVILTEPDMYFSMTYYFYNIRLGKKCTEKLINYCRETVISKACEIYDFLNLKAVYKSLDKQSHLIFLQNLFPKDLKKYTYDKVGCFLKYFPKAEQFRLFSSLFEKTYRLEIWDDKKYLSDELFPLIQDEEERLKWIDIKIKSGTPPKTFYHYYEINKALGLIKEKLNITMSVESRVLLVEKLVLACKFNNDVQALKDVLQYFCQDLKKVNSRIRSAFLSSLDMNFDLSELSEEHWKFINEVLHIQKAKKEKYYRRGEISMKHVEYLWKNKQPIKDRIAELLLNEDLEIFDPCNIFNKYSKFEELEREVIKIIDETLPQVTNNASTLHAKRLKLVKHIVRRYNKHHKNKILLSDYPSLTNSLITYVENAVTEERENYELIWIFKHFLGTKEQSEFNTKIAEIYFEHGLEQYKTHSIILRYLKYDPMFLSKYIDGIVRSICTTPCYEFKPKIWDYVKKLTYLELHEKCIQFCLENYAQAKNPEDMLFILARLMHPEDYVNFVSKHAPQVERMDCDNENDKKYCDIEIAVATSLKYTKSVAALPVLVNFCIDSCLQNSLNSLYYLFYHIPEDKLYDFLDKLSERPSLRKYIFSLTAQIGCVHRVFNLLKSATEHETDASIKKHLLNSTFKYFKKNPLDNFFNLLISCIPTLNIFDSESLEPIVSQLDIPKQFQGRYYAFVLEFLSRLAEEHSEVWVEANKYLGQIIDEVMKQLPYDFCASFINKYFLEKGHCFSEWSVREFIIDFLYDCDRDYEEKLNVVLRKLVTHYRDNLNGIETRIQAIHRILFVVSTLVSLFTTDKDVAHAQIFFNRFFDCFAIEDFIGIYIQLKSLLIKKQFPNIIEYANEMNSFLNELSSKYTSNVITHFADGLKKNRRPKEGLEDIYELCFELHKINQNVNACLLILSLLPKEIPNQHIRANFFSLLESLGSHSDVTVKIAFSTYIHSLEIEDNGRRGTILEAYGMKPMINS